MKRQYNLLLHPLFLLSLFLLLLNDASLKYEFHNAFTGKLSDFTGLFVFTLFWIAVFPNQKYLVSTSIALIFVWWKSPLSASFIQLWNETMPFSITRVVDYRDLTALVMIPLALLLARSSYDPRVRYRKIFVPLVGCISLFAFCFTSPPRYALYYSEPNQIHFYGDFVTDKTEQQILDKLAGQQIRFHKDSVGYYPLRDERYVLRVSDQQNHSIKWIPINNMQDSTLYIRRSESPFYVIPTYQLNGYELKDVKFSIERRGKKNHVNVQTFQWNNREEFSGKMKKMYKKHFKQLFE